MTLLVNPHAGRGHAGRVLPQVTAALVRGLPRHVLHVVQTLDFDDARTQAREAVQYCMDTQAEDDEPDLLLVMGGDGMASIGLNACAGTPVQLGVIPAGTGNDFVRGMGVPSTTGAAVEGIVAARVRHVDLMRAQGALTEGERTRYVGSVVSTGYDARVNLRTNNRTWSLGSLSYGWAALAELARFHALHYRLEIDGVRREQDAMLIAVGNAGVIGGGMRMCPFADPSDGLLEITIVRPVGRTTLLRLLKRMYDGSFVRDPCVEVLRARHVRVDGDDMFAMADGEQLGAVPLDLEIQRDALLLLGADAWTPPPVPGPPMPNPAMADAREDDDAR